MLLLLLLLLLHSGLVLPVENGEGPIRIFLVQLMSGCCTQTIKSTNTDNAFGIAQ